MTIVLSGHADAEAVVARLAAAGCVAAEQEAAELLGASPDRDVLESWLRRRERGEPLAWIVGTVRFCGHTIVVNPHVYVPRWQSETLARRAAELMPRRGARAVDMCTGAGAIAVHLASAVDDATVVGTDLDVTAVRCARRNGVLAIVADLGGPLRADAFDIVTVVAPYVPTGEIASLPTDVQRYEPRVALDGGDDGLAVVRRAAHNAARLLVPGGWFLTEVGGDQAAALAPTLTELGYTEFESWFDDDGDLRGVAARNSVRSPAPDPR